SSYLLPLVDVFSGRHFDLGKVSVPGFGAIRVLNKDEIAVPAVPASHAAAQVGIRDDRSGRGGDHRGAAGIGDVDAIMIMKHAPVVAARRLDKVARGLRRG